MPKAKEEVQLGRRIKELRLKKGLSQEDLAEPAYSAAYISHVEHGKRRPSHDALTHIAHKLGLTAEQLSSGRDPDEDLRLEVATQRSMAQIHEGKLEEALADLGAVLDAATSSGHERVQDLAEIGIATALYRQGRVEESLGRFSRLLDRVPAAPPERRTSAVVGKARCHLHLNEAREAIHELEAHLAELLSADEPDPGCLVETYAALIPGYFETGLIERAMEVAAKGWKLAPNIEDPDRRACLYVNRAQLLLTQGQPREALTSLALAEELYRHLDWYAEAVKVSLARSYVLTEEKRFDEAEGLILAALEEAGDAIARADEVRALTRLALISRMKGHPEEGLRLSTKALRRAGTEFQGSAAAAHREAGLSSIEVGDVESGFTHLRRSLKDFQEVGNHQEAATTAKILGQALIGRGEVEAGTQVLVEGLDSVADLR